MTLKLQELLKSQEEGQLIIHSTVNSGEKVLRSTRSDGKDLINNQLKEIQTDWDRLVKKIATSKVHIESSLLQWADYNSSYSHLEQWISDREAKLEEVCELKVRKNIAYKILLFLLLNKKICNFLAVNFSITIMNSLTIVYFYVSITIRY